MSLSKVIHVNDHSIETAIKNKKIVVVYFGATWCGPCKILGPRLEALAATSKFYLAKVDIDNNPELAEEYNVGTFIFSAIFGLYNSL
jgi:thioredoxin-like negative regulator of GroEL